MSVAGCESSEWTTVKAEGDNAHSVGRDTKKRRGMIPGAFFWPNETKVFYVRTKISDALSP